MTKQLEVLIVEDQEVDREFLSEIMEENGYRYRTAKNGALAMKALGEARPSLILLDIMMPGRSGVFLYKDIKRDPEYEDIPVIFVTGASAVTGVNIRTGEERPKEVRADIALRGVGTMIAETLAQLDPDGIVDKPLDPAQLLAMIRRVLGQG